MKTKTSTKKVPPPKAKPVKALYVTTTGGRPIFTCRKCKVSQFANGMQETDRYPISHAINEITFLCSCSKCKTENEFTIDVEIPKRDQVEPKKVVKQIVEVKKVNHSNKQGRKICQHCGAKRNINQLEAVTEKDGKYFQANKRITLYVCRKARRKSNGYYFQYCNNENERPEISRY